MQDLWSSRWRCLRAKFSRMLHHVYWDFPMFQKNLVLHFQGPAIDKVYIPDDKSSLTPSWEIKTSLGNSNRLFGRTYCLYHKDLAAQGRRYSLKTETVFFFGLSRISSMTCTTLHCVGMGAALLPFPEGLLFLAWFYTQVIFSNTIDFNLNVSFNTFI